MLMDRLARVSAHIALCCRNPLNLAALSKEPLNCGDLQIYMKNQESDSECCGVPTPDMSYSQHKL